MAASPAERVLAAELVVGLAVVTVSSIRQNRGAPHPQQFVGLVGVFGVLSAVALVSPPAGKVAAGFGALMLGTMVVRRGPDVIGALTTAAGGSTATPAGNGAQPAKGGRALVVSLDKTPPGSSTVLASGAGTTGTLV